MTTTAATPLAGGTTAADTASAPQRFHRYPPGTGNVLVPTGSRRAALAGLALHAPCRPLGIWRQRLAMAATVTVGPRALGRRSPWEPPTGADAWQALWSAWTGSVGPIDGFAVYERTRRVRTGVSVLLLHHGRPTAFVRVRSGDDPLRRERTALSALAGDGLGTVRVPLLLGHGSTSGWSWLATTAPDLGAHRPPRRPPIGTIVDELTAALVAADLGDDDVGRPPGWVPVHGDLTPWNLRQRGKDLWLVDWEDVGWGPPGSDELYYAASSAVITGAATSHRAPAEAVEFWLDRVTRRLRDDPTSSFNAGLATLLPGMAA